METRLGPTIVGRSPEDSLGNYDCGLFQACRISIAEDNMWRSMEAETAGIKKDCSCCLKTDEEVLVA